MNTNDSPHQHHPKAGWQILGELELPVNLSIETALHSGLTEIFSPLQLQADILNKIIQSAQDAVTRIIRSNAAPIFEHIHFIIFTPSNRMHNKSTWSFFRVEKPQEAGDDRADADHAIEFYLYGEGD